MDFEPSKIPGYLFKPEQVKKALNLLDLRSTKVNFKELYLEFEREIGLKHGESFPIVRVQISGSVCRARLNNDAFKSARRVEQIGVKEKNISQGRANPYNIPIFYGANSKKTAAFEVLQNEPIGDYLVTIGCWKSSNGLWLANFVDGSDSDFKDVPFVHSFPERYLANWPVEAKESATLISKYFTSKFKQKYSPSLYNITNVIAMICFSLIDIEGIGYGSTSDDFQGYNIALKNPKLLKCVLVEEWFIRKSTTEDYSYMKSKTGKINDDDTITW
ncbi:hypothetical protein [Pedobacter sp. UC225_65]|uniref:hypothetical protein n=1 Tax=Pedobacter sp. UC225_65 TaxID=3350173 RepID=UPI003672BB0C